VFERLPQQRVKPALALSLHTTRADLRQQLLPRAPRIDPADLVAAGEPTHAPRATRSSTSGR
jgi:23S rRNA (adenine2503-C2)-methyltransferase